MDPIRNPFAPGAGTQPPELAGRTKIMGAMGIALQRVKRGLPAKSVVLVGLRGVGKTVLLDRMKKDAEAVGIHTLRIEAPEGRSLPGMLAPQLRLSLLRLSRVEKTKALALRGLQALAGFAQALKLKYADIEVGLDLQPEAGLADNGDLEQDLLALLETVGQAARGADTALAMFIDELQYVKEDELAALITALHRCTQQQVPVIMIGAGLPQIRGRLGRAKSYAERLFDFPEIGPLAVEDAQRAISKPLEAEGASIEDRALDRIVTET
ncbi:MAG: ATP-binding protein, partial [Spirochaetota bacterium]